MRVREAERVGMLVGAVQVLLAHRLVLISLTVRTRAPHDQVVPFSGGDVVCPVPLSAQVDHSTPQRVPVRVHMSSVVLGAENSAEGERGACELATEAHVESDVAVVVVHVEPQVLPLPILDQEGVVRAEARPLAWEEQPCQRQHHARLQVVKQWPHPDLVQDEAVVIHGVWPLNGLPARLVSLALGEQLGAECGLQHLKRKHPAGHLLREDRAQCGLGPVSQGRC
mmetsp:Transcript_27849/g.90013  ORF Transcript_27849/g.90013 Transcript_27849/m.90013 type:complete len:225 (-) Transcript_27849:85-759(-)